MIIEDLKQRSARTGLVKTVHAAALSILTRVIDKIYKPKGITFPLQKLPNSELKYLQLFIWNSIILENFMQAPQKRERPTDAAYVPLPGGTFQPEHYTSHDIARVTRFFLIFYI